MLLLAAHICRTCVKVRGPAWADIQLSLRRMLAKLSAHRFLAHCRALHAFTSTESICLHAPWSRGRSELSLFRTVDMASRSVTRSALDTPSSAEGIDHVSDRLSRLAAGPFPPVSMSDSATALLVQTHCGMYCAAENAIMTETVT